MTARQVAVLIDAVAFFLVGVGIGLAFHHHLTIAIMAITVGALLWLVSDQIT